MHVPHVHRHDLLKGTAALAPLVVAGRAFAAPETQDTIELGQPVGGHR